MKYKGIIACLCAFLLTGCGNNSNSNTQKSLFEGMDAKQTYEEVIKKMNNDVSYLKTVTDDTGNTTTSETYKIDNALCFVSKSVFEEGAYQVLSYTITHGKNFYSLYLGADNIYNYEVVDDYPNVVEKLYTDYSTDENYKIYDIQREDKDDHIVLTIQFQVTEITGGGEDQTEIRYAKDEIIINKDGLISQEKMIYYTDEQFKEKTEESKTINNSDFNKKNKEDFNKEIELMKSCDGLNDTQVKEKLGLN